MSTVAPDATDGAGGSDSADRFEIVALAASAGGIGALGKVLGEFPAGFRVPVLVVQHLDRRHETVIASVLARRTALQVKLAEANEHIAAGTVYVAPPDRHLLVDAAGVLTLTGSELVHFVRPSADLLFESVAGAYGPRAVATVLSGTGQDGAMGLAAVKARGGTTIVQDPASAEFSGMPEAVVAAGPVDFVLPLDEIGAVIRGLIDVGTR
jgi:two-component system chemotaxis response regulator CheB